MPFLAGLELPPEVDPDLRWPGITMTWTGYDGSVWHLTTGEEGLVLTAGAVTGLGPPKHDRYTSVSPALAGSRWTGRRTIERDVFWPILLFTEVGSSDWVRLDRAFWATLHPDFPGVWSVTDPDGFTRTLTCRSVTEDDGYTLDPIKSGWAAYGVKLIAEQPFWVGSPSARAYGPAAARNFFLTSGGTFYLSPASTFDSATISNPGDEAAWPIWTVTGEMDGGTLGIPTGGNISWSETIPAGRVWTIDTRPDRMTAYDDLGVDHSAAITWNPAPVPPGSEVRLDITLVGAESGADVAVQIIPLYHRAF